jgi:hypothetical protein
LRDDEGKSSDWVEIHNSSSRDLQLAGYRLTDDLDNLDKWIFPDHRVSADSHFLVWMSGRSRQSLAPAMLRSSETTFLFETTLIDQGADWRYLSHRPSGTDASLPGKPPENWTAVEFDDPDFAVGRAGFGYGDEDDETELISGTTVVLLRHEFVLKTHSASESLVLEVDYDDGFVAYLNGKRVLTVNAPSESLSFNSVAIDSHDAGVPERFDLSAHVGLLRSGKNVFAIAGLNISRDSSDLSLHPTLGTLPHACHANFRLKKKGGALFLVAPDGKVVDQVEYSNQVSDQSLGRSAADQANWGYFLTPTPGSANIGLQQTQPIRLRLSLVPEVGAFEENIEVHIHGESSAEVDIRYTRDGTDPNESSDLYRGPIKLVDTTLVRAAAFAGKERAGSIVSGTYLVGQRPMLPILAITMKPAAFNEVHLRINATGHGSERPAFMEFFDQAGRRIVATGFGLRLHGGAGRNGSLNTKKSYRAYFRKAYGDGRLDSRIIPEARVENFDKIVLRASSNDRATHGSSIRDQVIRDLHADMGALASRGSWCVLLINSTRRGVYNLTERMDEEFLASHLGPAEYDVMKTGESVLSGSREDWDDLRHFVTTTDFSDDANFEKLSDRVDIANLTSYVIVNMCLQNFDWPHNNWYAARRVPDGKWIFLCWDSEWGLGYRHPGLGDAPYGIDVDPYAFMDSGGAYGNSLIRKLFLALIDNPGYCEYYQKEVRRYLSGPLSTENMMRHIRRHRDAIAHEIEIEYRARGKNTEGWYKQIEEVEYFARKCPGYFQKYTDEYFSYRSSPNDEDRLAMIEDPDGRLHVIYRGTNGPLRELASSTDGNVWADEVIRIPATAPLPAGSPAVYSLTPGNLRILYRGKKGHLHELSFPENITESGVWQHTDLTSLLQQPPAICDPSVVVVEGVPHIVYVDEKSRLREFWLDRVWRHHSLPAVPRPASDAVISVTPGALHVTYRTMYGVPCCQTLSLVAASEGRRYWTHRLTQRIPSEGQPIGLNTGGKWRVIFRPAEKWPVREPFIFHWDGRLRQGYREYNGSRNGLIQAWDQRQRFQHLEPVGKPSIRAAGNPVVLYDAKGDRHYIAYRDTLGHIHEASEMPLVTDDPTAVSDREIWQIKDVTTLAGAPPAAGEPAGLVSVRNGARNYVYRGREGKLHEIRFDGQWSHRELTAAASVVRPK